MKIVTFPLFFTALGVTILVTVSRWLHPATFSYELHTSVFAITVVAGLVIILSHR